MIATQQHRQDLKVHDGGSSPFTPFGFRPSGKGVAPPAVAFFGSEADSSLAVASSTGGAAAASPVPGAASEDGSGGDGSGEDSSGEGEDSSEGSSSGRSGGRSGGG